MENYIKLFIYFGIFSQYLGVLRRYRCKPRLGKVHSGVNLSGSGSSEHYALTLFALHVDKFHVKVFYVFD